MWRPFLELVADGLCDAVCRKPGIGPDPWVPQMISWQQQSFAWTHLDSEHAGRFGPRRRIAPRSSTECSTARLCRAVRLLTQARDSGEPRRRPSLYSHFPTSYLGMRIDHTTDVRPLTIRSWCAPYPAST